MLLIATTQLILSFTFRSFVKGSENFEFAITQDKIESFTENYNSNMFLQF